MFRRRDPLPLGDRLREFFSPKKGWRRGYRYLGKRMQRLPDTPHRIALGFACGVFASFTPFFGFHFVIAAALAWVLRANVLASATGTFVGNPLTFPFIAGASFWMGRKITGIHFNEPHHGWTFGWLWDNLDAIFLPYLIGGLLPGLAASVAFYAVMRPMIAAYQNRRRSKLMAVAKERVRQAHERRRAAKEAKQAAKAAKVAPIRGAGDTTG
ncbi:DUF2062 domain-containing protein [Albimonas sp. CAU 1670]|uniref:DUF2062 domain-containing protein n=1 Tax=Albimonas sp. CAU 1670 TaxID=3032599 RepID=UPI0023D9AE26|nr:DUF2062 domain-containing protein [Albimonas sp. CAU 1670]MDF2232666.1 DUF2062 domain-containing protein [Albimonas sp. CAU 1670]